MSFSLPLEGIASKTNDTPLQLEIKKILCVQNDVAYIPFVQSHLHLDAAGHRHLPVGQPGLLHRPHPGRDLGFKRRRSGEPLSNGT